MQITIRLADWNYVSNLERSGELADALQGWDETENWIRYPAIWWSDSAIHFQAVANTWKQMLPELEDENQQHARKSIEKLFGKNPTYELKSEMGQWFLAISPSTVLSISQAFSNVSTSRFEALFELHCDDFGSGILQDYDEDFLKYLNQWQNALSEAADLNRGILGYAG